MKSREGAKQRRQKRRKKGPALRLFVVFPSSFLRSFAPSRLFISLRLVALHSYQLDSFRADKISAGCRRNERQRIESSNRGFRGWPRIREERVRGNAWRIGWSSPSSPSAFIRAIRGSNALDCGRSPRQVVCVFSWQSLFCAGAAGVRRRSCTVGDECVGYPVFSKRRATVARGVAPGWRASRGRARSWTRDATCGAAKSVARCRMSGEKAPAAAGKLRHGGEEGELFAARWGGLGANGSVPDGRSVGFGSADA